MLRLIAYPRETEVFDICYLVQGSWNSEVLKKLAHCFRQECKQLIHLSCFINKKCNRCNLYQLAHNRIHD